MTALAAAKARPSRKLGVKHRIPMNTSTTIYAGGMVMIDPDGYGRPAAALASNTGVCGVATETVTNSGADGAAYVEVQEGEYLFTGTTLTATVLGAKVYAEDDDTVDETQGSNEPVAGIATEYVSSTQAWVKIGMSERLL